MNYLCLLLLLISSGLLATRHVPKGTELLWQECLPGEAWTQDCNPCYCDAKGNKRCGPRKGPCVLVSDCQYPVTWYTKTERCYCDASGITVCYTLQYGEGMNNQGCPVRGAHFSNDCIQCHCMSDYTTRCFRISCEKLIGVCTPGEIVRRDCFECSCTLTGFQVCIPIPNCTENKPGKCPDIKNVSVVTLLWCFFNKSQKCYYDMECPGNQLCCFYNSCTKVCTDPI